MGKNKRGYRDGSGPFLGSWQRKKKKMGKRQERGEPCLKK